jgi:hypothetical protein
MIKIEQIKVLDGHKIFFHFSDNFEKVIDFTPFIGNDKFTSMLKDEQYFAQVKVYENGRGIYWANSYDVCPDYLRNYEYSYPK